MEDMDPIEELQEVRKKIVAKAGGTPAGLMRYLRSLEKKEARKTGKRIINAPARKVVKRSKVVAP